MGGTEPRDRTDTGLGLWLRRELRPGDVMMDVGANVGDFTALAAEVVGPSGRVYAFEPGPDNLAALRARFGTTGTVQIVDAAVSDSTGEATFFLDRRDGRRHSLARENVGKRGAAIAVRQVALDDYLETVPRVDVIKIDAQGAEPRIIRGARRLLAHFRPRILLELWPFGLGSLGSDSTTLLAELRAQDYDVYRVSAKGQLKSDIATVRPGRWPSINVVALPRRHWLRRLATRLLARSLKLWRTRSAR